jgi:type II secretory pathway component PulF
MSPKSVTPKAALEFTEMMSTLLDAGLSLRDALELLSMMRGARHGAKPNAASQLAGELLAELRKGVSFARAIQQRPDVFSVIYTGMISIGDRVGSIERIFPRLTGYLREQKKTRERIASALAYPVLVLAVSLIGSVALAFVIIPKLDAIFAGFGADASQQIHANIRRFEVLFGSFGGVCVALIIFLAVCACFHKTNEQFACCFDSVLLRLPLIGALLTAWQTLNFAFAMETLAGGGVSIESALVEAASVVSNSAYRSALREVRERVVKGVTLSTVFAERVEFPAYLSQWLAIGEKSGKTEQVFAQIRAYFQDEIDRSTARLLTLVEPAMIVLVGVLLLAMVSGIMLPLFSMYGSIL